MSPSSSVLGETASTHRQAGRQRASSASPCTAARTEMGSVDRHRLAVLQAAHALPHHLRQSGVTAIGEHLLDTDGTRAARVRALCATRTRRRATAVGRLRVGGRRTGDTRRVTLTAGVPPRRGSWASHAPWTPARTAQTCARADGDTWPRQTGCQRICVGAAK